MKNIISLLQGKKTFIIGICGVVWGVYTGNNEIVLMSLGMMGIKCGQLGI